MANNELGIRFTEEKYATKSEVVNDLHITAIDSFWSNILAYRNQFNRFVNLRTVDHELVSLCCCTSVNALIYNTENKILCLNREFLKVFQNTDNLRKTIDFSYNRIKKCGFSENYTSSLEHIYQFYNRANGEDYLAELYSSINDIQEITSFYRTDDSVAKENTAIIDRIYKCAPSGLIEGMMNDLFTFSVNDSFSSIVKFAFNYLYMVYIRPFDKNYKEIAMLYAKSILAKESLGELAIILPFEEILADDKILENAINQTQKTLDTTYYIKYFLEKILVLVNEFIDIFKNSGIPSAVPTKGKQVVIIDEKESASILNRLEIQLMQEDPRLKKKEAHFYSRHHEIGRKYSIAEYKKFNRCVYETARTSMDHLAEIGYYKKIQVKNKFVYETIER